MGWSFVLVCPYPHCSIGFAARTADSCEWAHLMLMLGAKCLNRRDTEDAEKN